MLKKISSLVLVLSVLLPIVVSAEDNGREFMRMPCTGGALYNSMTGEKCPTTGTATISPTAVTYNPTCASTAVIAQENSMQSIREAFEASIKTAFSTRRDALGAAYLKTSQEERSTAIKAALDAFRTAQKAAEKTRKDAEKTLMDSFKTTMQGCGITRNDMMRMGEQMGMGEKMINEMVKAMGKNEKKPPMNNQMKPVRANDDSESNDR